MGNPIAFIYCLQNFGIEYTGGVFFRLNFFSEIFRPFFNISNFSIAYRKKWFQNQILKRKTIFIIAFPQIRY